jgi:hypothetical protein
VSRRNAAGLRIAKKLVVRASFIALLVLVSPFVGACAPNAGSFVAATARSEFSRESYCPIERVKAFPLVGVSEAPTAITRDEERLAMWRAAAVAHARTEPRKRVEVTGCGEHAVYACWESGGRVPGRRRMAWETIGAACMRED